MKFLEPVNDLSIDESRYTSCNQAKLETTCNNPTGLFEKFLCISRLKAQLLGNG
jgi:hypothetical protein